MRGLSDNVATAAGGQDGTYRNSTRPHYTRNQFVKLAFHMPTNGSSSVQA